MVWQICLAAWAIASSGALAIWLVGGADRTGMAMFFAAQIASSIVLVMLDRRDRPMTELASLLFAGANLVVTLGRWRWELMVVAAVATVAFVLLAVHRVPGQRPATMDPSDQLIWWAAIGLIVVAILSVPLGWTDPHLDCILWCG